MTWLHLMTHSFQILSRIHLTFEFKDRQLSGLDTIYHTISLHYRKMPEWYDIEEEDEEMVELLAHIQELERIDSESSNEQRIKRARNNELDDQIMISVLFDGRLLRDEKLCRRRWDEPFMRNLATSERSWIREVRLDPKSFDILSDMLENYLSVDKKMAALSSKSGNDVNKSSNFFRHHFYVYFHKDVLLMKSIDIIFRNYNNSFTLSWCTHYDGRWTSN